MVQPIYYALVNNLLHPHDKLQLSLYYAVSYRGSDYHDNKIYKITQGNVLLLTLRMLT